MDKLNFFDKFLKHLIFFKNILKMLILMLVFVIYYFKLSIGYLNHYLYYSKSQNLKYYHFLY